MIRAGWLAGGKMVIYPIRDRIDAEGGQLVNWVAEIETPRHRARDWNRPGTIDDFIGAFDDWRFDWLDVPSVHPRRRRDPRIPDDRPGPAAMVERRDGSPCSAMPRTRWSRAARTAPGRRSWMPGRWPIACVAHDDVVDAFKAYEAKRLEPTASVVRMSRTNPPDAILREVYQRTGDRPFARIEDVISNEELAALSDGYKRVAGYDRESMQGGAR